MIMTIEGLCSYGFSSCCRPYIVCKYHGIPQFLRREDLTGLLPLAQQCDGKLSNNRKLSRPTSNGPETLQQWGFVPTLPTCPSLLTASAWSCGQLFTASGTGGRGWENEVSLRCRPGPVSLQVPSQ